MEQEVDTASEKELLGAGDLFKLFDLFWKGAFGPPVQVTVQAMEDQGVEGAHAVAFVEAKWPLRIYPIKALEIIAVYYGLERQAH